jgi:hypothetical protein
MTKSQLKAEIKKILNRRTTIVDISEDGKYTKADVHPLFVEDMTKLFLKLFDRGSLTLRTLLTISVLINIALSILVIWQISSKAIKVEYCDSYGGDNVWHQYQINWAYDNGGIK